MNWSQFISAEYAARKSPLGIAAKPRFSPPATSEDLDLLEQALQSDISSSLREVLLETDGIMEMLAIDDGPWFENMWLLWSVDEIIQMNLLHRWDSRHRDVQETCSKLAFFADAGCDGIQFGNLVTNGIATEPVQVWYPYENRVLEIAPRLREFYTDWLAAKITV